MDKVERVRAALRGEAVDRLPFTLYFHFPEEQWAGEPMARAHLDYYRAADPDILKVMNDNYYSPPGFETLSRPSDWRRLRPAPLSSPCFQNQLSGLRRIVDAVRGEVLVIATIFNPFHDGDWMSGWKASEHLRADPEAVNEGLSTVADSTSGFARACVQAGADGIFFASHGGGRGRHTREEFDRYIKPHDLAVLGAASDAGASFNLLHICGSDLRLEAYADHPAHAVNWAPQLENLTLTEGGRLFRRTVVGGLDQAGPLVGGDRGRVVSEVEKAIGEMGTKGFILGAGCALKSVVPAERIGWVKRALEDHRGA